MQVTQLEGKQKQAGKAKHFDKAFLIKDGLEEGFVYFLTQYVADPYLDIELPEADLIECECSENFNQSNFLELIDAQFERPQLIRATYNKFPIFQERGFERIKNKEGIEGGVLIPVKRKIGQNEEFTIDKKIELMQKADIPKIEELFKEQYSLRHRLVKHLFSGDPQSCFVYKEGGKVLGLTFNRLEKTHLYCRQILVRRGSRGMGIGSKLNYFRFDYAKNKGLLCIKANIREETKAFHMVKHGAIFDSGEIQFYTVRYPKTLNTSKTM